MPTTLPKTPVFYLSYKFSSRMVPAKLLRSLARRRPSVPAGTGPEPSNYFYVSKETLGVVHTTTAMVVAAAAADSPAEHVSSSLFTITLFGRATQQLASECLVAPWAHTRAGCCCVGITHTLEYPCSLRKLPPHLMLLPS